MPTPILTKPAKSIIAEGFFFGVDQAILKEAFDSSHPYSYCRICGWLYQPASQRKHVPTALTLTGAPNDSLAKRRQRQIACDRHSAHHTSAEKAEVGEYGITPEAQYRLAAFGIANLTAIALNKDVAKAGLESPLPGVWLPDTSPNVLHK